MARIRRHVLFDAVHGRLGDFVVKHCKHGTILCRKPRRRVVPPSAEQIIQEERMKAAAEYYWRVKADPALEACYEREAKKKGCGISALTLRDFSRPPWVHAIDLGRYNGIVDHIIAVQAYDDTYVKAVELTLRDAATGAVLEHGQAVRSDGREGWIYRAKSNVPLGMVVTVEAVALDLPGNRGAKEVTWERQMVGGATPTSQGTDSVPRVTAAAELDFDPRAG